MDALGLAELLRKPLAELPRELELVPVPGPFHVAVTPPGSKSMTNRALLLAALAEGTSELRGALLDADDAQVMIGALRQLGAEIEIEIEGNGDMRIVGCAGRFKGGCTLNLNNAGTATRFLTAAACLADAPVEVDGNARMRERPIGELIEMLRTIGVQVEERGKPGRLPLRVHPVGASSERPTLRVGRTASSQFVSAMLMLGPRLARGLAVEFVGSPTSAAYIDMTLAMMGQWLGQRFGTARAGDSVSVGPGRYMAQRAVIEPDASGATYFWGAGAVVRGSQCVVGLDAARSIQSDAAFAGVATRALRGGEFDFTLMPDAAMTLAAVACFAEGTTTITGLRTLRVKETDRLAAVKHELSKIGVGVEIFSYADKDGSMDEGMRITPPVGGVDCSLSAARVVFETYDDHRMAMSLAIIGLLRPNVVIREPQCVAKTYLTFWRDWSALYESAAAGGARMAAGR